MPLFLALESSTPVGSAAVGDASRVLAEMMLKVGGAASASLLPAADSVIRSAGMRADQLDAVVVGSGPGSFTGLRIAGATAKGIALARGIPIFAYSGLLAAAASGSGGSGAICALFDARGRDVFAAEYDFGAGGLRRPLCLEVLREPEALTIDELLASFGGRPLPRFTGDGAVRHQPMIEATGGSVVPPHLGGPRAAALLWLAATFPDLGRVEDATAWEPEYLRASGAERIAAERERQGASR